MIVKKKGDSAVSIKNTETMQQFSEERFTRNVLFQEGKTTAFMLNFLPGQSLPPHPHPNAHVYIFVVQGEGTCTIDEEELSLSEKDVIHCADQQKLSIENTGNEPLSLYVVMAKND